MRERAREDERPDVVPLVDDDQRGGAGALEQSVDVVGPVLEVGPEDHLAARVDGARAVRQLPDVDSQVGHGGPARFDHGVSSPLSRPESAEATPTSPGRGPSRTRHISISRFPRAVPPRWQHPPGPPRGRGRRPSGAVGRRPSVRLNRNVLGLKEPPLRTTQTVMGGRIRPRSPPRRRCMRYWFANSQDEQALLLVSPFQETNLNYPCISSLCWI